MTTVYGESIRQSMNGKIEAALVPHVGWLLHPAGDEVARYLDEGWYEYREQAFIWLYAREGDVFIDGGAHFGLYSVLYGIAADKASVWAVEPNPSILPFLKRNLKLHQRGRAIVVASALSDRVGESAFYSCEMPRAAYSGFLTADEGLSTISVSCTTLDRLTADQSVAAADLVKLDLEGAELDALRGASESIGAKRLPLLMVEFTEHNLERAGRTSQTLFAELESTGYAVCRFDEQRLELTRVEYSGPVGYDNYFAALDPEGVNRRLRDAPTSHRRIARAILKRGKTCDQMRTSIQMRTAALDDTRRLLDDTRSMLDDTRRLLEDAWARLGEANWRVDHASKMAEESQRELEGLKSSLYVRVLLRAGLLNRRKTGGVVR